MAAALLQRSKKNIELLMAVIDRSAFMSSTRRAYQLQSGALAVRGVCVSAPMTMRRMSIGSNVAMRSVGAETSARRMTTQAGAAMRVSAISGQRRSYFYNHDQGASIMALKASRRSGIAAFASAADEDRFLSDETEAEDDILDAEVESVMEDIDSFSADKEDEISSIGASDSVSSFDTLMAEDATIMPSSRTPIDQENACKVYVGNLGFEVDVDELRNLGEEFGTLVDCTLIRDKYTGRSRGFGFIEYSNQAEADSAINTLDGQDFLGRTLRVSAPRPRGQAPPKPRFQRAQYQLYVGNIPWDLRENDLEDIFQDFGPTRTSIPMDGTRSKGFGFVHFANEDDRNSAMSSLDGAEIQGRPIRVSIAIARDRPRGGPRGPRNDYYESNRGYRESNRNDYNEDFQRY